ncbi:Isy1-like splicing family-domain-containing protein [Tuber borchii]|uniref:Isy1-like splicing family-domain-containing protein n=1 Tax=Tuber borchii TaxID=42251 RepID=A0A2T6ZXJ6_TUBBO|nr:Isy1-like splicing family-domain-containing protein [Tuber borchii]
MPLRFREQQAADQRIMDASLSDYQIHDPNDEINKQTLEKHMWEMQLRNPGGPKSMRLGLKAYEDGARCPLPGVKELFDELRPSKKAAEGKDGERRLRAEIRRNVGPDYYGFNRDEDTGTKEVERCMKDMLEEVLMMYITSSTAEMMYSGLEQDAWEMSNNERSEGDSSM